MNRQPVRSSNLKTVGYDQKTNVLEIEFHSGGVYQYLNVPESMYQALLNAASKGAYFHGNIKERFRYKRVK